MILIEVLIIALCIGILSYLLKLHECILEVQKTVLKIHGNTMKRKWNAERFYIGDAYGFVNGKSVNSPIYRCGGCRHRWTGDKNYCPNCGRRMKEPYKGERSE